MVINLPLGRLSLFPHTGTNAATEGDYVQKKAMIQIWVVGNTGGPLDLGKNGVVEWTALCPYILLVDKVVDEDSCYVVLVVHVNQGFLGTHYEKCIDCFCIS